jgi:phospholipid/cholesterol/gamma-HCH transport system ATP-binding protein
MTMNVQLTYEHPYPVEVAGLVASYGEQVVLDGVDFYARRGLINVILGGSGSGKSTLLRNILGLYQPVAGSVRLFGVPINELSDRELKTVRSEIGVVFQNGALFTSMTVGDNIATVIQEHASLPPEIIAQIVRMKLALVGLEGAVTKFPEELSGGMRKRAAVARAIALDPKVLFCDEPSAGLDPVTASELDDLLLSLKRLFDMTIVVVTHELESIKKIADRIVMLDNGKTIADGTLAELLASRDQTVYDFFNRISHTSEKEAASLLSSVDIEPV